MFLPFVHKKTPNVDFSKREAKKSFGFERKPNLIPQRGKSVPRGGPRQNRNWWQSKKYLRILNREPTRFRSEVRVARKVETNDNIKQHIMLEFAADGLSEQINLVPVDNRPQKLKPLDLF